MNIDWNDGMEPPNTQWVDEYRTEAILDDILEDTWTSRWWKENWSKWAELGIFSIPHMLQKERNKLREESMMQIAENTLFLKYYSTPFKNVTNFGDFIVVDKGEEMNDEVEIIGLHLSGTGLKFKFGGSHFKDILNYIKDHIPGFYRQYNRETKEWMIAFQYANPLFASLKQQSFISTTAYAETLKWTDKAPKPSHIILTDEFSLGASKAFGNGMKGSYAQGNSMPGNPFGFFFPHDILWDWFEVRKQIPKGEVDPLEIQHLRDPDPRIVLGVTLKDSEEVIRRKWRTLVIKYHPDKGGDPELFMSVQKAFEILTSSDGRKKLKKLETMQKMFGDGTQELNEKKEWEEAPVLFKPPFTQGRITIAIEPVLDRYIVVDIHEWNF